MDTKAQQFLTIVQTGLLANCINLKHEDMASDEKAMMSASFCMGLLGDAVRASERIPENMTVQKAACEFLGFMLPNLREEGATVPFWFANLR